MRTKTYARDADGDAVNTAATKRANKARAACMVVPRFMAPPWSPHLHFIMILGKLWRHRSHGARQDLGIPTFPSWVYPATVPRPLQPPRR